MHDLDQTIDDTRRAKAGPASTDAGPPPEHIGRFRVERLLGQGGFGCVYLAHDEQLNRPVAIKVPHSRLVSRVDEAAAYLAEARTVAVLDHPNIVPVYDVGSSEPFPCFIVSKYVDGVDLAARLKQSRLPLTEAVELVATVAEALHYAHKQGLVHRDIKPGNLLLDKTGKPFVTDFGLALREGDVGKEPCYFGTPAYMSPEQARGEGHRVDGRSDIFSLGIVFYELLTGRGPFEGGTQSATLEKITDIEARPPRQIDDQIPKELERICLKALSKRATERYTTAKDMADDLRAWLGGLTQERTLTQTGPLAGYTGPMAAPTGPMAAHTGPLHTSVGGTAEVPTGPVAAAHSTQISIADSRPLKIVPRGLRSFDANDADFFLELLPGPRDRDGLPDSLRFWKTRIEAVQTEDAASAGAFAVGLIYGPSGCGKSSLVKAGLLPRLAATVTCVYVEMAGLESEARLLKALWRHIPALPTTLSLVESLAALRQGRYLAAGRKVLLVLDQFEQWLHARRNESDAELVQALRQCDGSRVQCLILVRDDFWLAVSRFMQALEIRVVEGENAKLVDLFDPRHARRVLAAFGRAFGTLPDRDAELSREQGDFLDQAVAGLTQDGKVISVRLALFAEMVKGKPWVPATLRAVGGTEGVGVTFLEENFAAANAPPPHRIHREAAQAVLKALLPEAGTDIKGRMRSQQELLEASGYAGRPRDFEDLLHILDGQLRLITPGDPGEAAGQAPGRAAEGQAYQLTHDYLVPSLRDWLTRKQKETRRGRAELCLVDRAALWTSRPENRYLPSLWEFVTIRLLTNAKSHSEPQRRMMAVATRVYSFRLGLAALAIAMLAGATREIVSRFQAAALVEQLVGADVAQVPRIVDRLAGYRRWADPLLHKELERSRPDSTARLHTALALLSVDPAQAEYLGRQLLEVPPPQFVVVRDGLRPPSAKLVADLWKAALDPQRPAPLRFQAAAGLATYVPADPRWNKLGALVAGRLVSLSASEFLAWREAFRPARGQLIEPLSAIYGDTAAHEQSRTYAAEALADYAGDRPNVLFDLLATAELYQFPVIYAKLAAHAEIAASLAQAELTKSLSALAPEEEKEALAQRQARAAVALFKLGAADALWPLLQHSPDPRVRSYLIHWMGPLGADPQAVIRRLDVEPDVTVCRALLLMLGEFTEAQLPEAQRESLLEKALILFQTEPDAGLHAAAQWLLQKWGLHAQVDAITAKRRASKEQAQPAALAAGPRRWFVNSQGQTFAILSGGEFFMGSPPDDPDRAANEPLHRVRIPRRFAIATTAVTKAQYRTFQQAVKCEDLANMAALAKVVRTDDSPQTAVRWYEAALYCNWLSQQDGLPKEQWCYAPSDKGEFGPGMKAKSRHLQLAGYRLPTEAEWEYACRSGTVTSRYYGSSDALLRYYAWYAANGQKRTWPVATLKPNDFGLFDMLGNAYAWCEDAYGKYPADQAGPTEDTGATQSIDNDEPRISRGGAFDVAAGLVRAANRQDEQPAEQDYNYGFRPVRTIP